MLREAREAGMALEREALPEGWQVRVAGGELVAAYAAESKLSLGG